VQTGKERSLGRKEEEGRRTITFSGSEWEEEEEQKTLKCPWCFSMEYKTISMAG